MRLYDAPPLFMKKPAGSMLLQPTKDGLQVFIRETKSNLARFPRPCSVDVRMPTWDMPPVITAAFLVHIARADRIAYQCWINGGSLPGVQILTKLSTTSDIFIHFVTDRAARTVRTQNVLKRKAADLLRKISSKHGRWSMEDLEAAQQRIYELYPTTWSLWRSMKMDRRG